MPTRRTASAVLLLLGGALILMSAIVHGAINVPHLRGDMAEIGVRSSLVGAISLVLYFSVVAMFAFAALVLADGIAVLRGTMPQLVPLWAIAGSYVVFGAIAYVVMGGSPHTLGHAVMGLLVAVGAALARPRPEPRPGGAV